MAIAATMLACAAFLLYAGRHLTFFFDEWNFVLDRRGGGTATFLDPHNGHIAVFSVLVYKALFALVGLRHYLPYQVVGVVLHLTCGGLLYVLARRRLGPWLALVPAALLLFMGTAYQDLLWPFQIGFFASVAGGLGALAMRERRTGRSDAGASAFLVWSVAGSAVGIPFLLAAATMLVAQRGPWRRLWIVGLPAVLFAIWYLGWGTSEHVTAQSVLGAPQYVADAAAGASAGIAGLNESWGPPLAVAALATGVLSWRLRERGAPTALLLAAAVGALAFWLLSAIARADFADPTASRYLYIGAAFILLMAAEAGAGAVVRRGALAAGAVVLAGVLIANIAALRAGERGLRASDTSVKASLTAVQVAAPVVSPAFTPDLANAPQLTAGAYLAAERDLGSPAFDQSELNAQPEPIRERADQVLGRAERLAAAPAALRFPPGASEGPPVEAVFGGRVTKITCDTLVPTTPLGSLDVRVGVGRALYLRASANQPVNVYARRFAAEFAGSPVATVQGHSTAIIRLPVDQAPERPWHIQIVASGPASLCVG